MASSVLPTIIFQEDFPEAAASIPDSRGQWALATSLFFAQMS